MESAEWLRGRVEALAEAPLPPQGSPFPPNDATLTQVARFVKTFRSPLAKPPSPKQQHPLNEQQAGGGKGDAEGNQGGTFSSADECEEAKAATSAEKAKPAKKVGRASAEVKAKGRVTNKGRKSPSTVVETLTDEAPEAKDLQPSSCSPEPLEDPEDQLLEPELECEFGRLGDFAQVEGPATFVCKRPDHHYAIITFSGSPLAAFSEFLNKVDAAPLFAHKETFLGFRPELELAQGRGITKELICVLQDLTQSLTQYKRKVIELEGPLKGDLITLTQTHLDSILKVHLTDEKPSCEREFWRVREEDLSALRSALDVHPEDEWKKNVELQRLVGGVDALLLEARAISQTLDRVRRHFQELEECESVDEADRVLPDLTEGLRWLWVLCLPFYQDERMERLLHAVAALIATKLSHILSLDNLFRDGPEAAMGKAKAAADLLRRWKEHYLRLRGAIERAEHTPRWDFDLCELFAHTDYITRVCLDIVQVCQTLLELRAVLNSELKAVVRGRQAEVDAFLKAEAALLAPLQDADYEAFVASNADSWRSFVVHFRKNADNLDRAVATFLDDAIAQGQVSLSEEVLTLLVRFGCTQTRPLVREVVRGKVGVAVGQLRSEVGEGRRLFQGDVRSTLRRQASGVGAVWWARRLFLSLKRSVVHFRRLLPPEAAPEAALEEYRLLVRQVRAFEAERFAAWSADAEDVVRSTLNSSVVRVVTTKDDLRRRQGGAERRLGSLLSSQSEVVGGVASEASSRLLLRPLLASLRWVARAVAARKASVAARLPRLGPEAADASAPTLGLRFEVAFDDRLLRTLAEANDLEDLGFALPTSVRVAADHAHFYQTTVTKIRESICRLNGMVGSLSAAEVALLQLPLKRVERRVLPGVERVRWASQSVAEFGATVDAAVDSFEAALLHARLAAAKADALVGAVHSRNLLHAPSTHALPWMDFFEQVRLNQELSVAEMQTAFQGLSQVLMDLEYQLDGTRSGGKACMRSYYIHWEQIFFEALLRAIVGSLRTFSELLRGGEGTLLQVDALLDPEGLLQLDPKPSEALETLLGAVERVVATADAFPRWEDGTCLPSRAFTFRRDVEKIAKVALEAADLKDAAQQLIQKVESELYKWNRFSHLWRHDKAATVAAFASRRPSIVQLEGKLEYFSRLEQRVEGLQGWVGVGCVRLRVAPLLGRIAKHAAEWKWQLAQGVLAASRRDAAAFLAATWALRADLQQDDALDTVLATIVAVRAQNADRHVHAHLLAHNFHTLAAHNVEVEKRDLELSLALWPQWQEVLALSKAAARRHAAKLGERAEATRVAAAELDRRCLDLALRFAALESACGDLGQGQALLDELGRDLSSLSEEKRRLATDAFLFDVPLPPQDPLAPLHTQLHHLQLIFDLFAQLRNTEAKWSSTLWVDVVSGSLSSSVEGLAAEFGRLPEAAKGLWAAGRLEAELEGLRRDVPLVEALKSEALRERHWLRLQPTKGSELRLRDLLRLRLHERRDEALALLHQAQQELQLERALERLHAQWQLLDFRVTPTDPPTLQDTFERTLCTVHAHQMQLATLLDSRFVEPFLDKVRAWEEKLSIVEECVTLWSMISNLWTEVWSLFGVREADVPPEAAEAFGATRKVYLALVGEAGKSPQVLATCAAPGYAKRLRSLLAALEADAASFRRLLAAHRQNLPRLHFVPDRQLVALLAAPLPLCFQRILGKKSNAYPHISRVEMEGDSAEGWTLTGFTSIEGELVPFERPFKVDPEAGRAFLLSRLDEAIKAAVAASVARSVAAPAGDVVGVVEGAAATLWQPALDVAWTEQVEGSLRKGVAPSCAPFDAALAAVVDALRGQRPRVQAAKLAAAVVLLAHHRSVVERLVAAAAAHPDHFLWHTQLRFYSSPPQPLQVRQAFAQLDYGYEFSGIGGQIVRTLASERATLASTQALSLKCDVLLRGWGKASVVRDLAKSVGRRLVETHCGGGGSQVGRLLVGVAQTGFWGCLGRLEALDPSALSLLAARLRTLRAARLLALPSFALDAATPELRLHPAGAIFATAASKPHRKQLPLTLTALFRPAACAQPDLLAVCAVNLQAITFKNYKKLSRKMTKILELSRDRLSSQTHYEFGVSFANVTFDFLRASLTNRKVEEAEEEELLAMALRKSVLHRLHSDDRATFDQLMADIFVRINSSPEDQIVIREKISALMNRNNLKVIEGQSRQVCHVVEALQLRGWVAVLGASGGGKSVVLQAALQVLEAEICPLNPKACTLDEFFGLEGPDRVEGLLSSCLRRASGSAKKKALLFDAQIEPGWFDALSAALLDFPDQDDVLFVFESDAMPRATPTLLHRAPVVFIDPATVHFKEIWEAKRFDSSAELQGLFERFAVPLLEQLDKWRTLVPFSATAAVEQLSDVLAALMKSSGPSDLAPTFLQAVRLSLGALLPTDLRPEFDLKVRKAAADDLLLPPDEGSLFDFCWCPQKQTWIRWQDEAVPSERFVPTPTTAFFHWILDRFNQSCFHDLVFKKVSRPLVLIGCEGSSKSLTVQTFLSNLDPSTQAWQSLNFSLQTSAADVLSALKGWLRLRTRNVAQPADNKKLLLFLDDLHMPLHDELGSQEPIEFLRALLQNGGFYNDRDSNFQWVRLENVGFIGSITCDELNPTRVSPRFLARLNLVLAPKISDEQLHHIFSTLLSNHLRDFSPQVQQLADTIISASLHLYSVLSESLGATPERWMCRPGVLDLTRLVVGMCQARPGNFGEPETLVRVWRHEVDRVFVDRLESLADRREAERLVQDAVHHFFAPFERHALRNPLLFGDFRNALVAQRQHPRCYEDLLDFEAVFFLFQEVLEEYNKGSEEKLEVVLLDSGLEHVSRLHRVLRMRRGHSVLVGPPGCGRRSLFRLAAHAAQCRPFRLPLCPRAATHTLRKVFDQVGSGTLDAAVVLVRDHHLRNKGVAEMVYQVISSGWVPSLFREGVQAEEFKAACVAGVHVVLSLERSTLLALTGEYPELLKFATLDWFRPWDQSALLKVSKHFIANSSLVVAEKKESVLAHVARTHEVAEGIFAQQHQSLGAINCSPRLYVDFVRHFLRLLETNLSRTHATLTELLTALAKIGKARDGLVEFREILREKETLLEKEKGASEDLVRKIVAVEEEREGKTEAWSEWERGVERQVRTLASDRLQVRRVLDCALPELAAAQQAIAALQQQDVAQIREYLLDSSPSSECLKQFVVQIPLLRGQESATADQILDNVQVFQKVFLLPDHDTLSHSACRKLKVLLKRCSTLDASILENVSAFKSLVGFVDAALQYCNVVREIKPKLEQIAGTELELTQAREKSGGVQEEVVLLERRISELSEEDSRRRQKVSEAERDATSFADRLTGLENLFASLQNDEERMLVSVNELEAEKRNLLGDCLLTSAFLSYAGPLSGVGPRKDAIEEWRRSLATLNIPFSPRFSPSKLLPHASRKLSFLGLEDADEATQLNCLLVFAAIRAPLCVDTQQQAADWVKTVEGRSLVMASALDGDLVERVRGAVETGTPLLLQDVGKSVDAALFDLLDELSKGGGEGKVRVGDEWVALHPQFRLYLNSREANPQLDAAVFSKTTVVDCTMSAQALEETLLRDVIGVKEPQVLKFHLEEKVRSLESRRRESELYSQLLRLLADVPEEVLLEDQQFLNNLRTTKDSISQCEKRISRTSDSEVFEATKAALLGVARRAAVVFSVLADLAHVSPTYLFSLTTFRHLLASALREGGDPGDAITTNVHRFVCRSLFPEHQLTFTMALVVRIGLCDGHLAADEVAFVFDDLEGAEGVEGAPTWLPPKAVQGAWLLQQRFPALFGPFLDTLQQEPWRKWIEEAVPEQQPLPDDWDQRLTPFQGLMVVRALRSDRLVPALRLFVCRNYGNHFITPVIPSMRSLLDESSARTPIVLVVSGGGVDPSTELHRLARQKGLDAGHFVSLAFTKHSQKEAMEAVLSASRQGQWLLLLNCHLVARLSALIWRHLDLSVPHPDFRLWLTTDDVAHLPPILLHHALKVVLEVPRGLKLKLTATFRKMDPEVMAASKHPHFGKVLYALAQLHATLQERCEFESLGWNGEYHFSKPDFDASAAFLGHFLNRCGSKVPWHSIRTFIQQVVYGAHMTDTWDLGLVGVYLRELCGAHVLGPKFAFYQDERVTYGLPAVHNLFGILAYVENLADDLNPAALGLHANADLRHNARALQTLRSNLAKLQPAPALAVCDGDEGAEREELLRALRLLRDAVPEGVAESGHAPESFIALEIRGFNRLLAAVRDSLDALQNVVSGKGGKMSRQKRETLDALRKERVPDAWQRLAPPTNKTLLPWTRHLKLRHKQYYEWVMIHEPLVAWLPGLASPRAFLQSVLQTACRKHHWPLELAGLAADFLPSTSASRLPALTDGVYVKGVHVENGGWDADGACLRVASPGELTQKLPVLRVTAVATAPQPHPGRVRLPLYFSSGHCDAALWHFDLPCKDHPSTYVLHAAKLLLHTDQLD